MFYEIDHRGLAKIAPTFARLSLLIGKKALPRYLARIYPFEFCLFDSLT